MIWYTCCFIFMEVKDREGECKFLLNRVEPLRTLPQDAWGTCLPWPCQQVSHQALGLSLFSWVAKGVNSVFWFAFSSEWSLVFFPNCNSHLPFSMDSLSFCSIFCQPFGIFFNTLRAFYLLGRWALSFLYKSQTFSLDFLVVSFVYRVFYPCRNVYFLVKCIHLSCVLLLDLEFS